MGACNSMPDRDKNILEIQAMAKRMRKKVLDMADVMKIHGHNII